MSSLSLCLIVKNEAVHLEECIRSFHGLYDELIIVDTGSTDQTVEIAQRLGAKVFHFQWIYDFSAARNFALAKATKEWVMMVDADDRLEATHDVRALIYPYLNDKETAVLLLPYIYNSRAGAEYNTTYLARIWKRSWNLKYIYPIHEGLDIATVPKKNIRSCDLNIIHHKIHDDIHQSLLRNIEIETKYLKKHPFDAHILYYLTHDSLHSKSYRKCFEAAKKYEKLTHTRPVMLNKVLQYKALAAIELQMWNSAIKTLLKAIDIQPELVEPYIYLGDIAFSLGQLDAAESYYLEAKNAVQPDPTQYFVNIFNYKYLPDIKLAYLYFQKTDFRKAYRHATLVESTNKNLPEIRYLLQQLSYVSSHS